MNSPDHDERTAASLQRRLMAAPKELRAMATAETADWRAPDFETDEAQQQVMHALLRACCDARAAVSGHSPADRPLDDEDRSDAPRVRRLAATERLIALENAIAAGIRANRMLRQRGLKATLMTSERLATGDKAVVARAEMSFRRRSTARSAP
jgi:hypothetical protein